MSQKEFVDTLVRIFVELKDRRTPGVIRQAIDEALVKTDCVVVPRRTIDPDIAMKDVAAWAQAMAGEQQGVSAEGVDDKTIEACKQRFSNTERYAGVPRRSLPRTVNQALCDSLRNTRFPT